MTIPGLAPDLQTLLAAAMQGEPLPRTSVPLWDESDEAGQARVQVGLLPPEDLMHTPEDPAPREEPETPESDEGPREVPEEDVMV